MRNQSLLAALLTLGLALGPSPARASDHWVGPLGSGQPFSNVQAAIDAAAPGDRVLLLPGTYGPARIHKPLQLTGAGSGVCRLLAPAGVVPLEVFGNGAPGRFRLSGFELGLAPGLDASPSAFLSLTDIPGPIEVVDLKIVRLEHDAASGAPSYIDIRNCAQAQFNAVRVYSQPGLAGADLGLTPLHGLQALESRVWFSDGRLEASDLATDLIGNLAGASAIELQGSELHLALCGVGGGSAQGQDPLLTAGPAIHLVDSQVVLYGGKSNHLQGGSAERSGLSGSVLAAPALVMDGTSSALWGADVIFSPGQGPAGTLALPIDAAPGALLDPRPDRLPSMWIASPIGAIGEFSPVFLEGDPGAIQFWWLVLATAPPFEIPGIFGPFVLDLTLVVSHDPVLLGVDGQASDTAFTPLNPNLQGRMLAYQSIEFDGLNLQFAPPWFVSFEIF